MQKSCRQCGSHLRETATFCSKCGVHINNGSIATTMAIDTRTVIPDGGQWMAFKSIFRLYVIFLCLILISGLIQKSLSNPIVDVVVWVLIALSTAYLVMPDRLILKESFTIRSNRPIVYLEIFSLAVITYLFITFYFSLFDSLRTETAYYSKAFFKHGWPVWSIYILVSVTPGIVEEIIFRGVIYQKLKDILNMKEALFVQAACFSVLHLNPLIFISHFAIGLFLGWVKERTGSLYLCMIFHMAWNAYVVTQELVR